MPSSTGVLAAARNLFAAARCFACLGSSPEWGVRCSKPRLRNASAVAMRRLHTVSSSPAARMLVSTSLLCSGYLLVSHFVFGVSGPLAIHEFLAEDAGLLSMLIVLWQLVRPFANKDAPKKKFGPLSSRVQSINPMVQSHSPTVGKVSHRRAALQNRRVQVRRSMDHLRDVVRSLSDSSTSTGPGRRRHMAASGSHNFHQQLPTEVVLPVEVAACQYPASVSRHLARLLEDQWLMFESCTTSQTLSSIPE
eukprot:TRINITY_DN67566_c0_g1_i1.p1 TRINITY_DN67566_c0_g1~~TRINITY_DN67566_c0_g1_i1.p1  ORF type:complete len:250 (+),score=34.07 TRINITY_DN67566_c0_g1_i1:186-935(+)